MRQRMWWRGFVLLLPVLAAFGVLRAESVQNSLPPGLERVSAATHSVLTRVEPSGLGRPEIRTATPAPALADQGRAAAATPAAALCGPERSAPLLARGAPRGTVGRPAAQQAVGDRHRGRAPPVPLGAGAPFSRV